MTFVGKLFVMVNLAFSMIMATVAFALYSSNVDYSPESKRDAQPKAPVRVTQLRAEIDNVTATVPAVQGSWRAARFANAKDYRGLLVLEAQRQKDRSEYRKLLLALREGKPGMPDSQVQEIEIGKDHLPVANLAPGATPPLRFTDALDRSGQPLLPLKSYENQMEAVRKENAAVLVSLEEQIRMGIELTNRLTGSADARGLRQMLVDERIKREGVIAEFNSLRPLFINTVVDSQLMRERVETMKEQIDQLKAYLHMKYKVDVVARGR